MRLGALVKEGNLEVRTAVKMQSVVACMQRFRLTDKVIGCGFETSSQNGMSCRCDVDTPEGSTKTGQRFIDAGSALITSVQLRNVATSLGAAGH